MCSEKNKKQWTEEQQNLLKQLYGLYGPKSWKKISKLFKKHGFRRKQIEIRQKWVNHMDPDILNEEWTHQQLLTLYKVFNEVGSKWCVIKNSIPGRTQVKIKNKFYGNVRVYIRFTLLYFEGKNCKNKRMINRIPPNILNEVYCGQKRFQFFKDEFRKVLEVMNFNIDKLILLNRIKNQESLYQQFCLQINKVFEQIKQNQQFKLTFEQNQSYYSDEDFEKSVKRYSTKNVLVSYKSLRKSKNNSDKSAISIKEQELSEEVNMKQIENKKISSVITIQPRKIEENEEIERVYVYYPWEVIKIKEEF